MISLSKKFLFFNSLAFQIVQKLLDAGANINVKDAEENVPIHMATEYVHH